LAKSKEEPSSVEDETSGSNSEVKEEVELDPELSAVPPAAIKCELECKQEEGFVRPKVIAVKYVICMLLQCYSPCDIVGLWRKMFSKVSVLK